MTADEARAIACPGDWRSGPIPMKNQPNILLILTDQQHHRMLSCAGNDYVRTPNLDRLAAEGTRFTRAYCANPVCVPSRFSLFTGRMPSHIGMRHNDSEGVRSLNPEEQRQGMGHLLREAGYLPVYGGKEHFPVDITATMLGFDPLTKDERWELAREAARFLRDPPDQPWCLVTSFINPHDICYHALRAGEPRNPLVQSAPTELANLDEALALPHGMAEETFFAEFCPPLPPNHLPQKDEPEAIRELLRLRPFRQHARKHWDEKQWRLHRWAYARLTEQVDRQIGVVLRALRESGQDGNTLVVFTSDHGDHDGAHKLEHKTEFYDEAVRVPFVMRHPGRIAGGRINQTHLINNGLDLLPTLCDYAGIEPPPGLNGASVRPRAECPEHSAPQRHVFAENQVSDMVCTGDWKYVEYFGGENPVQLYDLTRDPGETRNAAFDPGNEPVLTYHQALLARERRKNASSPAGSGASRGEDP